MQKSLFWSVRILPIIVVLLFVHYAGTLESQWMHFMSIHAPTLETWIDSLQWVHQYHYGLNLLLEMEIVGSSTLLIALLWHALTIDDVQRMFYPVFVGLLWLKTNWQRVLRRFLLVSPVIYGILCACSNVAYYTGHMPISEVLYNGQDDFKWLVVVMAVSFIATRSKKGA